MTDKEETNNYAQSIIFKLETINNFQAFTPVIKEVINLFNMDLSEPMKCPRFPFDDKVLYFADPFF